MPQQVSNLNVPDSYAMYMQQDHQSQMSLWILQRDVTAGGAGLGEAFAAYLNTLVPEDGVYRFVVQNYPTSIVSKTPEA